MQNSNLDSQISLNQFNHMIQSQYFEKKQTEKQKLFSKCLKEEFESKFQNKIQSNKFLQNIQQQYIYNCQNLYNWEDDYNYQEIIGVFNQKINTDINQQDKNDKNFQFSNIVQQNLKQNNSSKYWNCVERNIENKNNFFIQKEEQNSYDAFMICIYITLILVLLIIIGYVVIQFYQKYKLNQQMCMLEQKTMQIQEQNNSIHNQGKFDVFIPVRLNTQYNEPKIVSFEYQFENEFQKNSSSPHHIQDQKTAHTYDPLSFEFSSRLEQKIKIDESTYSPNSKQIKKKNQFQSQPTYDFDNSSQINNLNQNQIYQQNNKISTKSTCSNKNYFKSNNIGNFTPNNQQNNETYTNNIQELQSSNWEKTNFQKSKFTINPNPSFISYQKDSEDQLNKNQAKKYKTSIVKSNHGDENLKLTVGFDDFIDAQKIDLYLFYRTSFTFDNDTLLDHKYKLVDFLEKNNQYIQEQKHCFLKTEQIVEKQEIDSLKFNSTEFKLQLLQKTIEQSQNNYAFLEDQQIYFTNDQSNFTKYGLHMATLGGQQGQSQDILTLEIIYDINLKEKQISQIILQDISQIIDCEQKDIIILKTQKPISHSNHLIFYITFETQVDYTEVIKNLNIQSMVETVQNRINAYKPIEINYKPSQKQLLISVQDLNDIESVYLKSRFPPDKRGGFQYFFPNGFLTMSFNMQDKYDDKDNQWLDLRKASGQYGIFYIGPCKFNSEEEKYKDHFLSFMKIKLQSSQSIEGQSSVKQEIEQYQLQRKVQQDYQYEECELGKGTIGRGIQITNDPHVALQYTKPFQICGKTYRTFFQVRCDPYLVKKCADSPFFIVNNPQDIRPFKLIIYQEK